MTEPCSHRRTVEIFKGIMKCSNCGHIWDDADEPERRQRNKSIEQGLEMQEERAKRKEHFRQRNRLKYNND